jgi:hypothetical protein
MREHARFVRADADRVLTAAQDRITLIGPPDSLTGVAVLRNTSDEHVSIRDAAPVSGGKSKGLLQSLQIRSRFEANTEQAVSLSASLPSSLPPGEYDETVAIGGQPVPVRLVVQPRMRVEINPRSLHFVGTEPGTEHRAQLVLTNNGNIPVQVPSLRHATALDIDTLCSNLARAVREKGHEGSTATLDAFVKGIKKDMAGWFELGLDETWTIVEPGQALLLNLTVTLPDDIVVNRIYSGNFRLFDALIGYFVTPSPVDRPAPGRRSAGSGRE